MRSFERLIRDLDEREEGTRIVFDIDTFKRALENPPRTLENPPRIKMLNLQVMTYLVLRDPFDDNVPSPGKIARDCKLKIEEVNEALEGFREWGILEDKNNKNKGSDLI